MTTNPWAQRVDSGDWGAITSDVNEYGGALLPRLLTDAECGELRAMYDHDDLFRSTIIMGRHRFGEGEYRYFRSPYPEPVERLKQALYPRLLPIARDWWAKLGRDAIWPDTLDEWLDMCHAVDLVCPTAWHMSSHSSRVSGQMASRPSLAHQSRAIGRSRGYRACLSRSIGSGYGDRK